jgi:YidC/Oxa1 family membrane protein insertase
MAAFFHLVFYQPLYNGLILLMDLLPWFDAGIIVVLFTVLVKFILFPLSKSAVITQIRMKEIEPELRAIKEKYKDDSQEQARRTMEIYKEKKVNPFSGVFVVLLQLPIIFALYYIFLRSGLPNIDSSLLYPHIPKPNTLNMSFLGLINITQKSLFLALLAGVSSFFQAKFAAPPTPPKKDSPSFKDDLARGMSMQMRYMLPVIVFFISYKISGVVALYWFTSNVFTIVQELFLRRTRKAVTA